MKPMNATEQLIQYWQGKPESQAQREALECLLMYRARLRDDWPGQNLVLIGPTQSGKSTVVNALLGVDVAEPSAKAGFTQTIFGFAPTALDWPDAVASHVSVVEHEFLPWVVWDTPDFDSVQAMDYYTPLCEAIGESDCVVLLVSQEKYGDAVVWRWAQHLQDLGVAWRFVMNKVDPEQEGVLQSSALGYLADIGSEQSPLMLPSFRLAPKAWPDAIEQLRAQINDEDIANREASFAICEPALAPLRQQADAAAQWQAALAQQAQKLQAQMQESLSEQTRPPALDHAIVRLMELTDLPMFTRTIGRLRRLISAPLDWFRGEAKTEGSEYFADVQQRVWTAALAAVASLDGPQRQRMQGVLEGEHAQWQQASQARIEEADAAMAQDVEASAQSLYAKVSEQPLLLNSLRTLRVSMDVGAIVATVKTLGLAGMNLILAPAILAVTNTLTQSAVGIYVDRESNRLAQKSLERQNQLLADLFSQMLPWSDADLAPVLADPLRTEVLEAFR